MKRCFFYLLVIFLFCAACTREEEPLICCEYSPFFISLVHKDLRDEDLFANIRFKISQAPGEAIFRRDIFVHEKYRLEAREAHLHESVPVYYTTARFEDVYTSPLIEGDTHVRFLHIQPPYSLSKMFFEFEVEYKGEKVFSDKVYFTLKSSNGKELENYNTILDDIEYNKDFMIHNNIIGHPSNRVDLSIDFRKIISEHEKKGLAEKEK